MSICTISGLYTIADNTFSPGRSPLDLAEAFLEGGASIIQLRVKSPEGAARRKEWAEKIVRLKKKRPFTFIINDDAEMVLRVGADGVHLGKDDLSIAEAREILGPGKLIGYSSHSLEEAVAAEEAGADYVAFGAIFPTKTKGPGHPVQGIEKLRAVTQRLKTPVVAIGGIGRENFGAVRAAGAQAVAMITSLTRASDVPAEVQYYLERL